jgi:predicted DNA-binding transcriptional regulator
MALQGNLRDFSITQLLNLINIACKSGMLVIEGPTEVAQLCFRDGKLAYAQIGQEDNSLPSVLAATKKISPQQSASLKARAVQMTDKELGLLLINAGFFSQDVILTCLQEYYLDLVRRLFTWVEGYFHFEGNTLPADGKILVRVDLENLIIEGARQLKEMVQLQEEIPSLDMALKFTDRPGANLRNINLNVEEWRVVSFINPKNSIRQIARTTKMDELQIRRVVYSLLQAGLIEIVRPVSSTGPIGRSQFPTQNREEQKSLMNRLINRIKSL